jgi:hypothetical protein
MSERWRRHRNFARRLEKTPREFFSSADNINIVNALFGKSRSDLGQLADADPR